MDCVTKIKAQLRFAVFLPLFALIYTFASVASSETAVAVLREKRNAGATIASALKDKTPAEFGEAFKIPNVVGKSVLGTGIDAATFRVTLKDGSEFALKVAVPGKIGKHEKDIAIAAKQNVKLAGFMPAYIEQFSSDTPLAGFVTLATTLAGPNFLRLHKEENGGAYLKANFPVGAVRRFAYKLANDLVTLHGTASDGWCHNDVALRNLAISGEAGKQNQYFMLDLGKAKKRSENGGGCQEDFTAFQVFVLDLLNDDLYKGSKETDKPFTTANIDKIADDIGSTSYKQGQTALLATLKKYAEADLAKSDLLTAWVPGTTSRPAFTPVTKPFKA